MSPGYHERQRDFKLRLNDFINLLERGDMMIDVRDEGNLHLTSDTTFHDLMSAQVDNSTDAEPYDDIRDALTESLWIINMLTNESATASYRMILKAGHYDKIQATHEFYNPNDSSRQK